MAWLQLREEIDDEFREHTWREHEVQIAIAWRDVHRRDKHAERLRDWRWRQGDIGKQCAHEYRLAYYKRKRAEPGWSIGRNARKRVLIAEKKRCPVEAERLRQLRRVVNKRKWLKLKADQVRHEKRLVQMKDWRSSHKTELAERRRVRRSERKNSDPVWLAQCQAKRRVWRAAKREHLRQYQRDYRARVACEAKK